MMKTNTTTALLNDIKHFSKSSLQTVATVHDKSRPYLIKPKEFLSSLVDVRIGDDDTVLNHPLAQDISYTTCTLTSSTCTDGNELYTATPTVIQYYLINCQMEGARVQIALPLQWRKCLIIHCHGHRPRGIALQADLNIANTIAFQTYIKEGYCISMTSYRREGIILGDAMLDVNNVRDFVVHNFGEPDIVVLEGRSMGGAIVTYLSEVYPHLYHGATAIGAALYVDQKNEPKVLNLQYTPQFPILYLTNVSELGGPEKYRDNAKLNAELQGSTEDDNGEVPLSQLPEIIVPAIWEVSREGHNLVNFKERESAMLSLLTWIQYQTFITVRHIDNTQFLTPSSSQVTFSDEGAMGKVVSIDGVFESITINFQEHDLERLHIHQGKSFTMKVYSKIGGEQQVTVHLGTYPFVDVPANAYMIVFDPDTHFCKVVIKTFRYMSVAQQLQVKTDDAVFIPFRRQ